MHRSQSSTDQRRRERSLRSKGLGLLLLFQMFLIFEADCEGLSPEWNWLAGDQLVDRESSEFHPGGRSGASIWHDRLLNVTWMFGGKGFTNVPTGEPKLLNELWQFFPHEEKNQEEEKRMYFKKVQSQAATIPQSVKSNSSQRIEPPARMHAAMCGSEQRLVLFGGLGENNVPLGDLWVFHTRENRWEEISMTKASITARAHSAVWCFGPFMFLFGGQGDHETIHNDFWRLNIISMEWTILAGPDNQVEVKMPNGEYLLHAPRGRNGASSWVLDSALYMFGGNTLPSHINSPEISQGLTSDLWRYFPCNFTWEFMAGSVHAQLSSSHVGQGLYSHSNRPGSRLNAGAWADSCGGLWLFGGAGIDIHPSRSNKPSQLLSDIWRFDTKRRAWSFMGGSDEGDQPGRYQDQGRKSKFALPGGRADMAVLSDTIVFGGLGLGAQQRGGYLNDLWTVDVSAALSMAYDIPIWSLMLFIGVCTCILAVGLIIGLSPHCELRRGKESFHNRSYKQMELDGSQDAMEPFI